MNNRVLLLAMLAPILVVVLSLPAPASAEDEQLRQSIHSQQERAEKRQREIDSMENREQSITRELSQVERTMAELVAEVDARAAELKAIEQEETEARDRYRELQAWRDKLSGELVGLLSTLWPLHAGRTAGKLQGLETWREADRRFTWLGAVYRATADRMREVQQTSKQMAENLEQQTLLAEEAAQKLSNLNETKDDLLRKRLSLLAAKRRTEKKRENLESDLRSILSVIQELNYKLKSQRTKRFADNKKLLPWPVKGSVASSFSPWAKPARRGIILRAHETETVHAVFWGKVVHADILRGFGQVVILYHGHDYYSVYAYLSRSMVAPGQEVEKDEPIGTAGFDPHSKEPGLYFELRLGAKPINPQDWLYPK